MKARIRQQWFSFSLLSGSAVFLLALLVPGEAHAAPRSPLPPLPLVGPQLFHDRFNQPFVAKETNAVVQVDGVGIYVESGSGYAFERRGKTVPPYIVPAVNVLATNERSRVQVATETGAVSFWFKPDWTSGGFNAGSGPGEAVTLAEWAVLGQKDFAVGWSLQVSADGSGLYLLGAGDPVAQVLLQANINWQANEWHHLALNYSPEKTELWVDAELMAEGAGTIALPPELSGLVLGSSLLGADVAGGEFEEFYTYRRPLTAKEIAFHWRGTRDELALGPITEAELAARQAIAEKMKAERAALGLDEGGGGMQMMMSGPTAECVTNSPLYITNTVCAFDTNSGWTVTFDMQGTNSPADIFTTTNLSGNSITNSRWVLLERGPSCNTYQYTNQPTSQSYYILGSLQDSDNDGLTDAYEKLVSKTSPTNPDTDGDGISDRDEVILGTNPLVNEIALASGRLNYQYNGTGWLTNVFGGWTKSIGLDAEGNVAGVTP